jgi:acyl dehydratase
MFERKYFEDFNLGYQRTTKSRVITEESINFHAEESGDFFPHHMDEAWCNTQPFKHRIAHGTLIFTVAIGLTADKINDVAITYGYERLRFLQPVFINDAVNVVVTIREKREHKKPEFGLVVELVEAFNQHNKLVMVCEHILMVSKKQENA